MELGGGGGGGGEEPSESVGETKITDDTSQEAEHPDITPDTPAESIGSVAEIAKGNESDSPSRSIGSPPRPSPDAGTSDSAAKKGHGLKKWRRIRRDMSKDVPPPPDSAAILKRRLSVQEPSKNRDESKHKTDATDADGEASFASNLASSSAPAVVAGGLDPELSLLAASGGFSVGADSDNSEERSSKSSTAASAPRLKHEAAWFGRERSRGKGSGGRGSGHVAQQRSQRGRGGGVDASKKLRGDHLRLEKENSHSSIESDFRSSNAAFIRWGSLASSNGKQSERSVNDDGEHSDDAQTGEEVRSGYYKENGMTGDSLREDPDEDAPEEENVGKGNSYRPSTDLDPFAESIVLLQVVQEALETEIQKFEQLGKESTFNDSDGHLEETGGSNSPVMETDFFGLDQKINYLPHNLKEASVAVKTKESKVLELEAALDKIRFQGKPSETTDLPLLKENCKEMELELEGLLKNRIEAEIEHLIITRATESLKAVPVDHFFEERNTLIEDQAQVILILRDAENKAVMLKEQAEKLEARCKELLEMEEVLSLHNKVCRSSMCCFIQSVMLCLAFWWFVTQLMPPSDGVVPT